MSWNDIIIRISELGTESALAYLGASIVAIASAGWTIFKFLQESKTQGQSGGIKAQLKSIPDVVYVIQHTSENSEFTIPRDKDNVSRILSSIDNQSTILRNNISDTSRYLRQVHEAWRRSISKSHGVSDLAALAKDLMLASRKRYRADLFCPSSAVFNYYLDHNRGGLLSGFSSYLLSSEFAAQNMIVSPNGRAELRQIIKSAIGNPDLETFIPKTIIAGRAKNVLHKVIGSRVFPDLSPAINKDIYSYVNRIVLETIKKHDIDYIYPSMIAFASDLTHTIIHNSDLYNGDLRRYISFIVGEKRSVNINSIFHNMDICRNHLPVTNIVSSAWVAYRFKNGNADFSEIGQSAETILHGIKSGSNSRIKSIDIDIFLSEVECFHADVASILEFESKELLHDIEMWRRSVIDGSRLLNDVFSSRMHYLNG